MDYIQEFAQIQGTLLTLQRKEGKLKNLNLQNVDHTHKVQKVVECFQDIINLIKGSAKSKDVDHKLRQIYLFLILNTDTCVQEDLLCDKKWGHLVNSTPTLSKDLFLEIIWHTCLINHLTESIIYFPPVLSVELLDVVLTKLNTLSIDSLPFNSLRFLKAMYRKLLLMSHNANTHRCEEQCVGVTFKNYFITFLKYFKPSDTPNGNHLKYYLELVNSCLEDYVNCINSSDDIMDMYRMAVTFNYSMWHEDADYTVIPMVHEQLISVLVSYITPISVEIWASWSEVDTGSEFTLQKEIAQNMYKCLQLLKVAKEKNFAASSLNELINMLPSMARKPFDEDDEIKFADVEVILRKIPDKTSSQKKWLKALITKGDASVYSQESCLECIRNNLCLFDSEMVLALLYGTITHIASQDNDACFDDLKKLCLESIGHLSLNEQLDILKTYFEKYTIDDYLLCKDYSSDVIKVFNTATDVSLEIDEKLYTNFIVLSFQNPVNMIERLLKAAVASDNQARIVADVIRTLQPLHSLPADNNETHKKTLILHKIHELLHEKEELDFCESSFIYFTTRIIEDGVVSSEELLDICLLPALHSSITGRNWANVTLWLQTLQVVVDCPTEVNNTIEPTPLLLILAQVLENSYNNNFTFCGMSLIAREHAIVLGKHLLDSFISCRNNEDSDIKWLRKELLRSVSPVNLLYFSVLWSKFGKPIPQVTDWKAKIIHKHLLEESSLQSSTIECVNRKCVTLELLQLLPASTSQEWHTIAHNLLLAAFTSVCESSSIFVFDQLVMVLRLLSCFEMCPQISKRNKDCATSCLDYCVRNFGLVVKEEILENQQIIISAVSSTAMLQKVVHLRQNLPHAVQESCSSVLTSIIFLLINCALCNIKKHIQCESDSEKHVRKKKWDCILRSMGVMVSSAEETAVRQTLGARLLETHRIL